MIVAAIEVRQIVANPCAEACWYFTQTREQFRLSGLLHLAQVDDADIALQQVRQASWQELSDRVVLQELCEERKPLL